MMLREIIRRKRHRLLSIVILLGGVIFLFDVSKKSVDISSEIVFESIELQKVYGKWEVTEYLGKAVEYLGIDVNDETYIHEEEAYIDVMKQEYLKSIINVEMDNILFFRGPCELGYYYADYNELFFVYRQPLELEVTPPFICNLTTTS